MSADLSKKHLEKEMLKIFLAARDGKTEKIRSLLQASGQVTDMLHHCTFVDYHRRDINYTSLSIAAERGHIKMVRMFVEEFGVDIDQTCPGCHFMTALGAAVQGKHLEIIQYLVGRGCDVNLTNEGGKTALYIACNWGDIKTAMYLMQNGTHLEISDDEGNTCLMQACRRADNNMVKWLLSCGADVNKQNIHNNTALYFAACIDSASIAQMLLEHGAAMVKNKNGFTPVVKAATVRSYSVMECFAESPRVSKEDKIQGLELLGAMTLDMDIAYSYLHRAMKERYSNPSQVYPKPIYPLPILSHLQESVSLEELESRKSDSDLLRLECWATMYRVLGISNPSAWYVYYGYMMDQENDIQRKFAIPLMLQYADSTNDSVVKISSGYIETFLDILKAAFYKDITPSLTDLKNILSFIIKKLLENEDDQKAIAECIGCFGLNIVYILKPFLSQDPDSEEGTPQMELAENLVRLSSLLLQNQSVLHAAINALGNFDDGPYIVALVRLSLRCCADPNCKDKNGNTPLHLVAELSGRESRHRRRKLCVSIAGMLLQAGALAAVRNSKGKTALDLAASSSVKDVILKFPPSLQSLAAVAVLDNNIPFQSELSASQAAFVQLH